MKNMRSAGFWHEICTITETIRNISMRRFKRIAVMGVALGLISVCSIGAIDLNALVEQSKMMSPQMQQTLLSRQNTAIGYQIADSDDDELGITVSSGATTFSRTSVTEGVGLPTHDAMSIGAAPGVSFSLPNDGKTTIGLDLSGLKYTIVFDDSSKNWFEVAPKLTASHTFTFGESGDTRKDLVTTQTRLSADKDYETNLLQFENRLYTQITNILTQERSIATTKRSIADLEKTMSNALALNTITADSPSYMKYELDLEKLKNTLAGAEAKLTLALQQFISSFGIEYQSITSYPDFPELSLIEFASGNTSVLLSRIALEIAQQDLAIFQAKYDNSTVRLDGSLGTNLNTKDTAQSPTLFGSTSASVAVTYKDANNLSLSGSAAVVWNHADNKVNPSLTISGTWSNITGRGADTLELQQLQNKVLLAQIAYDQALQSYRESVSSMQNTIANWNLSIAQYFSTAQYNKKLLEQAESMYELGLGTQKDVDNAKITVEEDEQEYLSLLLQGLMYQNEIKILQL